MTVTESPLKTADTDNQSWFTCTPEPPSFVSRYSTDNCFAVKRLSSFVYRFFEKPSEVKKKKRTQNLLCKLNRTLAAFQLGFIVISQLWEVKPVEASEALLNKFCLLLVAFGNDSESLILPAGVLRPAEPWVLLDLGAVLVAIVKLFQPILINRPK